MSHRSYWLELRSPAELRARAFPRAGIEIARISGDEPARARRLWTEVGRGFWTERADWTEARWQARLADAAVSFFAAVEAGADLGGFELTREGEDARLEGFGLLPAWRGQGLGGGLLTAATQQAFTLGARRVWLHTATDDHPHALPNYLARGYRIFREAPLAEPMLPPSR